MMHIAFCTDTNYVMPTGVAMTSVCENNKDADITFHLVITDEGTATDEVNKKVAPLKDIAEKYHKQAIVYRMAADRIKSFVCRGGGYISTTAFSRIFLPELLPDDIKKVLYLDCDIVCNGSLSELWNTDLPEESPIGAVVDYNFALPQLYKKAQIPQSAHYINSGVLLMNLDCWRKNNYIELVSDVANEKKFSSLDQDTLNHVFWDRIQLLPAKYNVQIILLLDGIDNAHITLDYYDELSEACLNPVIIHYVTANKPWKNELCPLREIWEKYLLMTEWKDYKPISVKTDFDRTYLNKELLNTYCIDSRLFIKGLIPYLRFFRAAVKLKNKNNFIQFSSRCLNIISGFLEKVYSWKKH